MKKVLSIVLCLVMVFSLMPVFGTSALADYWDPSNPDQVDAEHDALHMTKNLIANGDGSYKIQIEAWATGTVDTQTITRNVPVDFVLVLDQSLSMSDGMLVLTKYNSSTLSWWSISNSNNYMYKVGDKYYRLEARHVGFMDFRISYRDDQGRYQDVTLVRQIFGSQGTTRLLTEISGTNVYVYTEGNQSRTEALGIAVNRFLTLVRQKSSAEADHRVALVGFSSEGYNTNEILSVGGTGSHETDPGGISDQAYKDALQYVNTTEGWNKLTTAAGNIRALGGTEPQRGFDIAEKILQKRELKTYSGGDRKTVVVFFTDGHPGNNETTDNIQAANDVVTAASAVKHDDWNTKIYSIGVFAAGDSEPITFGNTSSSARNWDNYTGNTSGSYYLLRGNPMEGDESYNDTIADYMRVVSSEYPNAENFLRHSGISDRGTYKHDRGDKVNISYYTLASDTEALTAAFENIAETTIVPSTETTLGTSAVLKDTVFTGDFEVKDAEVSVVTVGITKSGDGVAEKAGTETAFPAEKVKNLVADDGSISVTGFDYATKYCTQGHDGEKLIITIDNLLPKSGGHLWSNSGDAAIYPNASTDDPTIWIDEPELQVERVFNVIDFNYPIHLTSTRSNVNRTLINGEEIEYSRNAVEGNNGSYQLNGSEVSYKLFDGKLNPTGSADASTNSTDTYRMALNGIFRTVDSALFLENKSDGRLLWKEYVSVPSSSIYYDDNLTTVVEATDLSGDGFFAQVTDSADENQFANGKGKMVEYTFAGTGIDVYSKTVPNAKGYVVAQLLKKEVVDDVETTTVVDSLSIKNVSKDARYNVPSIFLRAPNGEYGVYTLRLYVPNGVDFQLDGIRVYNPAGQNLDDAALKAYDSVKEQNATFTNLREMILDGADEDSLAEKPGVGYFTDKEGDKSVAYVKNEDGEYTKVEYNAHTLGAYKVDGPKNEVYLESGTALVFTIDNWAADFAGKGLKLMIGLSACQKEAVTASLNGKAQVVESAADMYYEITPTADGNVSIANTDGGLLAVTYLKVSGGTAPVQPQLKNFVPQEDGATTLGVVDSEDYLVPGEREAVPMYLSVNEDTISFASMINALFDGAVSEIPVEEPAEPDEPDTPDVVQTLKDMLKQILSEFVQMLFNNIAKLFG